MKGMDTSSWRVGMGNRGAAILVETTHLWKERSIFVSLAHGKGL